MGQLFITKPLRKAAENSKKGDIYLVDSGGQYNFGTTDVTQNYFFR